MIDREYLTLQETALKLGKSAQTIRRMIKRGELKAQRMRTPQGFNYMVQNQSFSGVNNMVDKPVKPVMDSRNEVLTSQNEMVLSKSAIEKNVENDLIADDYFVLENCEYNSPTELNASTLQRLIEMHHKEKMMLFHILESLQAELSIGKRKSEPLLVRFVRKILG